MVHGGREGGVCRGHFGALKKIVWLLAEVKLFSLAGPVLGVSPVGEGWCVEEDIPPPRGDRERVFSSYRRQPASQAVRGWPGETSRSEHPVVCPTCLKSAALAGRQDALWHAMGLAARRYGEGSRALTRQQGAVRSPE